MTDHHSSKIAAECETVHTSTGSTRRRFVRGTAAGVTALVTLAPRSSLAATCFSASASASISLTNSRPNRDGVPCVGRTPGFWKEASTPPTNRSSRNSQTGTWAHYQEWLGTGAADLKFGDKFENPSHLSQMTFFEILENQNGGKASPGDPQMLASHLVAAWCNWKSKKVSSTIIDEDTLKEMSRYAYSGYYPVSGMTNPWSAQDIVDYLKSTMPL